MSARSYLPADAAAAPATAPARTTGFIPTSDWVEPSITLDRFPKLVSRANYQTWCEATEYILKVMDCWIIVANGDEPVKNEGEDDGHYQKRVDQYASRYRWTSYFFLKTIDPQWSHIITANKTPSRIWKALRDKFAISFHSQLASLLGMRVSSKSDLTKFDMAWTRLNNRCSIAQASDELKLPYDFKTVFESTEAKAVFLLSMLPPSIKDSLMLMDNLTYERCYEWLEDHWQLGGN